MTARWPKMMKRKTAAEYLDMSEAAFVREVLAGRLPVSIMIGAREHWDREAIDKSIDLLSGGLRRDNDDIPDYRKELIERYGS